MENKIFKNK